MDNSVPQPESDTQRKDSYLDSPQVFDNLLQRMRRSVNWLASLLKLTEEEQEDAGFFLGHLGDD